MTPLRDVRLGRNWLRIDDPCRVQGERGVFVFKGVTTGPTGTEWAECIGPVHNPRFRSFRVERLRRVRRDTPTMRDKRR